MIFKLCAICWIGNVLWSGFSMERCEDKFSNIEFWIWMIFIKRKKNVNSNTLYYSSTATWTKRNVTSSCENSDPDPLVFLSPLTCWLVVLMSNKCPLSSTMTCPPTEKTTFTGMLIYKNYKVTEQDLVKIWNLRKIGIFNFCQNNSVNWSADFSPQSCAIFVILKRKIIFEKLPFNLTIFDKWMKILIL